MFILPVRDPERSEKYLEPAYDGVEEDMGREEDGKYYPMMKLVHL